ncbi:hypothetical protein [Absidia glauca]|uniref:Uncharacterized protein n=1 Tax=Absidia glauca TaxID=4829 RepID=A0A163JDD5_ABSGL|nr:hypothetical protein [Absidia glauca]
MDLSWCIICDNRIDDRVIESSLYCSESCQGRDHLNGSVNAYQDQPISPPQLGPLKNIVRLNKVISNGSGSNTSTNNVSSPRIKRPNGPATSYPWELLYTRPRSKRHVVVKRCQPLVASSYTTATAMFSPNPATII